MPCEYASGLRLRLVVTLHLAVVSLRLAAATCIQAGLLRPGSNSSILGLSPGES